MTDFTFLPQPQRVRRREGWFQLPRQGIIGIQDRSLYELAEETRSLFPRHELAISRPRRAESLRLLLDPEQRFEGYTLRVREEGVRIDAQSPQGARHGVQTLMQLADQSPEGRLPCITITDWPEFAIRGVYYDVARGRVPKMERLLEMAGLLGHYKINHLQLYVEHSFHFREHPEIGKGASPLEAEDVMTLEAFCRDIGIDCVPSLASFGHMEKILSLKPYRKMAEDWGEGRYVDGEAPRPGWVTKGFTISPAHPETYDFLDSLYTEYLPLFSSERFNACCDETWDLGMGQTYDLCKQRGKGRVYLDHVERLNKMSREHGKKMMFWGDIIRNYPELISEIPKDVTVLDWGYDFDHPVARISDFRDAELEFIACPGTSSWNSLFPRIFESRSNIAAFADAARKNGAAGLLNTDWGDGGHYNFMELSWYGYLFGAEQAWNPTADQASFTERFCRHFLKIRRKDMVRAIETLGELAQLRAGGGNHSVWQKIFFARPDDPVLAAESDEGVVARQGKVRREPVVINGFQGRHTLKRLDKLREVFDKYARDKDCDPHGVLPYWLFSLDTMRHAARKVSVLSPGGRDDRAARRELRREMESLRKRFEKLWMERNRRSEIRITLAKYKKAMESL